MPRRIALIASTLALAVLLVGCGSDDDSSDDGGDTSTEESTTTAASDETTDDGATDPGGDDTTTAPEDGDPTTTTTGDGEGGDFCEVYSSFDTVADELPDETIEDVRDSSQLILDAIEDVAAVTPDELDEDMDLMVSTVTDLVDVVNAAETVDEAQEESAGVFSGEDFQAAADRIDTYFDENCPQADDEQAPAEDGEATTSTVG